VTSAAEELAEGKASAGLAADHGLAVPKLRAEIRKQILDGKLPHEVLLNEKVGEIKAPDRRARRQDPHGQGLPQARHFEDVMSIDTAFSSTGESFRRDMRAHGEGDDSSTTTAPRP